jgi:hypothetical protein
MKNSNPNTKKYLMNVLKLKASSSKPKASQLQIFSPKKFEAGFTVLFASLISSLVLSIGLAILNITLKQNTLSSAGRKTQQSFYAADAGIECALFLDRGKGQQNCRLGYFGTPSTTPTGDYVSSICGNLVSSDDQGSHECLGRTFTINHGSAGQTIIDTFEVTGDNTYEEDICFSVSVIKSMEVNPSTNIPELTTTFESRGYNTCDTSSPYRFERAIRVINS